MAETEPFTITPQLLGCTEDGLKVYAEARWGIARGPREHSQQTIHHEIETHPMRLSIMGEVRTRGGAPHSAGQVLDSLRDIVRPARGLTLGTIETLRELWESWHLNDMRALCSHQTPVYREGSMGYDLDAIPVCPETGYKPGSAWLYEPIPHGVPALVRDILTKQL